ncbi:hypothetical protein C7S18_07445 [Ahniella affigens]|uniref:Fibronectin type-III domain-containing protein n=1 Tax=Ahniella affigens TaxID=2021234 RepID=A0A2P1PQB0_9GAMM|nr:hypothetical protein [Ahniella affigens]AVP97036.1 hypothetical protein C7S18_07445 [Ahniella affigens]
MKQSYLRGLLVLSGCLVSASAVSTESSDVPHGTFKAAFSAIKFDVSPPLRNIPIKPEPPANFFGTLMIDPEPMGKYRFGPQDVDRNVQPVLPGPFRAIPAPIANFNAGSGTANPPDPVGDVGPNHYVRMSNVSFQIFNKTGTSVFGPANINTLFSGFGGACETENAGDPIVLYDQLADRWLLTQFSDSAGPGFFNCVALSQTSDPTGAYYRWAFPTATFPDYPKYGIWGNAYLISTREVNAGLIGAYAIDRTQMLAGNTAPTVIQFTVPVDENSGDGLLPADIDGSTLPPPGAPAYFLGSMDNGGPYGATQDALSLWEFNINFTTPGSSTFLLAATIPIDPYDTIFPCLPTDARACVPQPAPLNPVDILSYRQRPLNRAAYRNFGSYQSIVTNQSVEAATAMAGIRWWEVRNPGANAVLYQDSTYAPGITDGVHRWMGSIAQDKSGNMGLGYSASGTAVFPSVRYTGRLESDPLDTMTQGEGTFIAGGGGHTATTRRWGDYTSMNIDPTDDCTFWYINEFFATSGVTWTLRTGSFKFPDCGNPDFGVAAVPLNQRVCANTNATYTVESHAYNAFSGTVNLAANDLPAGATSSLPASFGAVPGTETWTISNLNAVAAGSYTLRVSGSSTSPSLLRERTVGLTVDSAAPVAPTASSPADGAQSVAYGPLLTWTATAQTQSYIAEIATDNAFTNIVFTSSPTAGTSVQVPAILTPATTYFWRVRGANACGPGSNSAVASFTTRFAPGICAVGEQIINAFSDNVDNGVNGWTTVPVSGTTWTRSTARPSNTAGGSGSFAWLAVDVATTSQQRLISPSIAIPNDRNSPTLRFLHDVTMEPDTATTCFDGGFVEISTNDGSTWTQLPPGSQLEDNYTGPVPTGEQAWCGTRPYRVASFDLGPYQGQSVRFRFTALTDSSVGSVPHGWYVDDIRVEGCGIPNDVFANSFE